MNVVIYARYSSHGQNEQSIEGQLKECREYANRNKYTIIAEYIDRAKTGTKDDREQFLKMIEDSKQKRFSGVLVYQLDRFARNKYDSAIYKKQLKDRGVRVLSAKENISDDPAGMMLETLLEGMAEYYSMELSQKVKRGRKINDENNYFSGGNLAYGYTTKEIDSQFMDLHGKPIKKKAIVVDETAACYVKQSFLDIYNGMKSYEVIEKLKTKGVKNSNGNYFNKSSFNRMLRNKKYITIATYDGQEHSGVYPRLVDDEVFYKVQQIIDNHKKNFNKLADDEFILVPKVFCGYCGSLMTGCGGTSKTGQVHHYYLCKNKKANVCEKKRIRKEFIEDIVVNKTRSLLTNDTINYIADSVVKIVESERDNSKLKQLTKSLTNIDRKKANLINAIAECDDSDIRKSLYEELSLIQTQRKAIEIDMLSEENYIGTLSRTNIKHFLNQLKIGNINSKKYRKSLIATFVKAVYVYDDKIIIAFNSSDNSIEVKYDDIKKAEEFFCSDTRFTTLILSPFGLFFLDFET